MQGTSCVLSAVRVQHEYGWPERRLEVVLSSFELRGQSFSCENGPEILCKLWGPCVAHFLSSGFPCRLGLKHIHMCVDSGGPCRIATGLHQLEGASFGNVRSLCFERAHKQTLYCDGWQLVFLNPFSQGCGKFNWDPLLRNDNNELDFVPNDTPKTKTTQFQTSAMVLFFEALWRVLGGLPLGRILSIS